MFLIVHYREEGELETLQEGIDFWAWVLNMYNEKLEEASEYPPSDENERLVVFYWNLRENTRDDYVQKQQRMVEINLNLHKMKVSFVYSEKN